MFAKLAQWECRMNAAEVRWARLAEARLRKALRRLRRSQRERRTLRVRLLGLNLF
jgi:hypothetical protein